MKYISKDNVVYEFKPDMEAVKKVSPPEVITFEANDAFKGQIRSEDKLLDEVDFSEVNPATGPLYVKGAERGDVLRVKILDMELPEQGATVVAPEEGILGDMVEEPRTRISNVEKDFVQFKQFQIPIRPNVGVIGVATLNEKYPTGTPWKHGGNMDTTDIGVGATVYLPVQQRGGMLALGDCHAVMGDGEICVSGCEVDADVTTKVDVVEKVKIEWPMVETEDSTMIIASGEDATKAIKEATRQAVEILSKGLNLDWYDAYILASLVVDLKISQMVDPTKTVRASIPKYILAPDDILDACKKA